MCVVLCASVDPSLVMFCDVDERGNESLKNCWRSYLDS